MNLYTNAHRVATYYTNLSDPGWLPPNCNYKVGGSLNYLKILYLFQFNLDIYETLTDNSSQIFMKL